MPSRTMSSHRSAARRRIDFQFPARHNSEPFAGLAPQPHAHAVADVKLHELLAVVENVNAAIGHHAVDVAENQLDLGASGARDSFLTQRRQALNREID